MARRDDHISWLPRTLPVRSQADLAPHHYVRDEQGRLVGRKGMPPKRIVEANALIADGQIGLNEYLDMIGVPSK